MASALEPTACADRETAVNVLKNDACATATTVGGVGGWAGSSVNCVHPTGMTTTNGEGIQPVSATGRGVAHNGAINFRGAGIWPIAATGGGVRMPGAVSRRVLPLRAGAIINDFGDR